MSLRTLTATLALLALAGCGTGVTLPGNRTPAAPQNVTGNWQIQSATGSQSTAAGILLLGDLTASGSTVNGVFRFSNLASGNTCGALNQVITVTGSVDATNPLAQVLTLTSVPFSGSILRTQITLPTLLQGFGTGTINVAGSTCTFPSSQAIAATFAPVTGSYSGTLTPLGTFPGNVTTNATATLTLAQATSPSADGQFATTGTLALTSGTCTSTTALTGTTSGIGTLLSSTVSLTAPTVLTLTATGAPLGATPNLTATVLTFPAPCATTLTQGAEYSGTLTKQ